MCVFSLLIISFRNYEVKIFIKLELKKVIFMKLWIWDIQVCCVNLLGYHRVPPLSQEEGCFFYTGERLRLRGHKYF